MPDQPWYRDLFDETYLASYAEVNDPALVARQVDALSALAHIEPPARILDLCCGQGRHSVELARRGFAVTGLDLSPVLLRAAQTAADAAGVRVDWVEADMRHPPAGPFDAVLNLFTAFGYLEDDAEDQAVLAACRRALAPGGRMVVDVMHLGGYCGRNPRGASQQWWRFKGGWLMDDTRLDAASLRLRTERTVVLDGGRMVPKRFDLRLYAPTELAAMARAAGFARAEVFGGLDGAPLAPDSHRCVLVASAD